MKLEITHDCSCESPLKYSGFELVSFSRTNVYDYIKLVDKFGDPVPANVGIRRRLDCGTAFLVSKYEHGNSVYGLLGEVTRCQWDTTRFYGILLLDKDACEHYHTFHDREIAARTMLEYYTMWANGECYEWVLTDDSGDAVDNCGGFIGLDDLRSGLPAFDPAVEFGCDFFDVDDCYEAARR